MSVPSRITYFGDSLTDDTPEDTTETMVTEVVHPDGNKAMLLSAFFGLDSALPRVLNRFIHREMGGKDGMPIVFSHELDPSTLQATTVTGLVGPYTYSDMTGAGLGLVVNPPAG